MWHHYLLELTIVNSLTQTRGVMFYSAVTVTHCETGWREAIWKREIPQRKFSITLELKSLR